MSQYPPSPYSTPQSQPIGYGHDPFAAYLAPARRAGILMFVLGGLGLTCALCMGLVAAFAPMEKLIAESGITLPSASETGMQPETLMRVGYGIIAGFSLLGALLLVVLAVFVRRGSKGAIITSMVLDCLIILILTINLVSSLIQILRSPTAVIGVVFVVVLLAGFVLLLFWLLQGLKATSAIKMMQMQYQQQYWQYQQQQQMYGYGYAQQQPAAMQQPAQPQPPAPAPPAQGGNDGSSSAG